MSQKPIINNIVETFGINRKTTLNLFKKNGFNVKQNIKFLNSKQQLEIDKNIKKYPTGKKILCWYKRKSKLFIQNKKL